MKQQSASQTVGPFFSIGMVYGELNNLVQDETAGERINLTGCILDGDGAPISDGVVEIWQADANGIYNHSKDARQSGADGAFFGYGRSETNDKGFYSFRTIRPGAVDDMAPHINVRILMRGLLLHVVTRLYFSDEDNSADPILNNIPKERRHTLIAQRDDSEGTPIYRLDFRMQGEDETVFFEP
ncbi:protocatechuate 3,4-dioxygenase subunit alpha [Chloroflexi bacterium TSY]|nr:protocatechuate 3,4-dioxygenase subunit alpha [Chloroflexi bacterium TSY]